MSAPTQRDLKDAQRPAFQLNARSLGMLEANAGINASASATASTTTIIGAGAMSAQRIEEQLGASFVNCHNQCGECGARHASTAPPMCGDFCAAAQSPLRSDYFREKLNKLRNQLARTDGDGDAEDNLRLNQIMLERIEDIEQNAKANTELLLITYQEWVDMQLTINGNAYEHVGKITKAVQESARQQACARNTTPARNAELCQLRSDLDNLVQLLLNVRSHNSWDLSTLHFETLNVQQMLDGTSCCSPPAAAAADSTLDDYHETINQLRGDVNALSIEVATKHDDNRKLRDVINCLEADITMAHQKVKLKDEYISDMRSQLEAQSANRTLELQPACADDVERVCANRSNVLTLNEEQFEQLRSAGEQTNERLCELHRHIDELVSTAKEATQESFELGQKRLLTIAQNLLNEHRETVWRLQHLRELLYAVNAEVPPASCVQQAVDGSEDAQLVDSIQRRMRAMEACSQQAQARSFQLEKQLSEMRANFDAKSLIFERSDVVLRELAELLSELQGTEFHYDDIYRGAQVKSNPFCTAILNLTQQEQQVTEAAYNSNSGEQLEIEKRATVKDRKL